MNQQPNPDHVAMCQAARAAVAACPAGVDQTDLVSELPPALQGHVSLLQADAVGSQIIAEAGIPNCGSTEGMRGTTIDLDRRCRQAGGWSRNRRSRCHRRRDPADPAPEPLPVSFDPAKNAWVVSSPNPTLRVAGHFNAPVGSWRHWIGFAVSLQKSYLQVAELNGRFFLRDVYHHAYGLLAAGIHGVPAFVREYQSFEEVCLPPGLLPQAA